MNLWEFVRIRTNFVHENWLRYEWPVLYEEKNRNNAFCHRTHFAPLYAIHLGSHGASSSSNISFLDRCILPTAEDMNLFIMVTVTW